MPDHGSDVIDHHAADLEPSSLDPTYLLEQEAAPPHHESEGSHTLWRANPFRVQGGREFRHGVDRRRTSHSS